MNKFLITLVAASACTLALAQNGAGNGNGAGPAAAAGSGNGAAMGNGMGRGPQAHRGLQFDDDNTPGWALMTEAEREAHRAAVTAFTDYDQCRTYVQRHHAEMMERARERGQTLAETPPGMPVKR